MQHNNLEIFLFCWNMYSLFFLYWKFIFTLTWKILCGHSFLNCLETYDGSFLNRISVWICLLSSVCAIWLCYFDSQQNIVLETETITKPSIKRSDIDWLRFLRLLITIALPRYKQQIKHYLSVMMKCRKICLR